MSNSVSVLQRADQRDSVFRIFKRAHHSNTSLCGTLSAVHFPCSYPEELWTIFRAQGSLRVCWTHGQFQDMKLSCSARIWLKMEELCVVSVLVNPNSVSLKVRFTLKHYQVGFWLEMTEVRTEAKFLCLVWVYSNKIRTYSVNSQLPTLKTLKNHHNIWCFA